MYAHTLSRTVVVVIPAQMCPQYTDVSAFIRTVVVVIPAQICPQYTDVSSFIRTVVSTTVSMLKFSPNTHVRCSGNQKNIS